MSEKFSKKPSFKKAKVNKTSLIAEREKKRLYHKYRKQLRKERTSITKSMKEEISKQQSNENEKHLSGNANSKQATSTNANNFKDAAKPYKTAYMKAQEEYESKLAMLQKVSDWNRQQQQQQRNAADRFKNSQMRLEKDVNSTSANVGETSSSAYNGNGQTNDMSMSNLNSLVPKESVV